jgi:membrane-associated phospholipid phosphatase
VQPDERSAVHSSPVAAASTPSVALALLGVAVIVVAGGWIAGHPAQVIPIAGRWWSRSWAARARARLGGGSRELLVASALVGVVGLALPVLVVWALGVLARTGPVAGADRSLFDWLVAHRSGWLTTAMSGLTGIGSYTATALVAILAGVGLALYRREALPLLLLATVPVEKYLQQAIASLVEAPRPPAALSIGSAGSYPSGGSARVVLVAGMVAWLLAQRSPGWRPAVAGWTVVALAAFAEGYSRLYLGRHWVSDVVGGWALGALLLAVLLAAASLMPLPWRRRLASPRRCWAAGAGGAGAGERP